MAGLPATPSRVVNVDQAANFRAITNGPRPAVIKFATTYCRPSQVIAPLYDQLSTEYLGMDFYDVDVDARPDIIDLCGVKQVPAFVVYKRGVKVASEFDAGSNFGPLKDFLKKALTA